MITTTRRDGMVLPVLVEQQEASTKQASSSSLTRIDIYKSQPPADGQQ